MLQGLGRKVWIDCDGCGMIWEGQFSASELNGFGRRITVHHSEHGEEEPYYYEIGYWKNGVLEGYGRCSRNKQVTEGIFSKGQLAKKSDQVDQDKKI